jgi:hypothetical protein
VPVRGRRCTRTVAMYFPGVLSQDAILLSEKKEPLEMNMRIEIRRYVCGMHCNSVK